MNESAAKVINIAPRQGDLFGAVKMFDGFVCSNVLASCRASSARAAKGGLLRQTRKIQGGIGTPLMCSLWGKKYGESLEMSDRRGFKFPRNGVFLGVFQSLESVAFVDVAR